jgi:hypothetical protein
MHTTGADSWKFDVRAKALVAFAAFAVILTTQPALGRTSQSRLAVLNAGIQQSEDSPYVAHDYRFMPGDFVYFTLEISGFGVATDAASQTRKLALTYELTPQDANATPLTPPVKGVIDEELHPEDKNWVPKRRASFLLPSFLAAGDYRVHVDVHDSVSKTETSADVPFQVGGVQIKPSPSITVQNFRFLRKEGDQQGLDVPAYSPGDTVYVRFDMSGYKLGPDNQYRLAYGLTVLGPDGKPFVQQPTAAELQSNSFYPAQFVPGNLDITTNKDSATGEYVLILTVRDLSSNQSSETKHAFSVER